MANSGLKLPASTVKRKQHVNKLTAICEKEETMHVVCVCCSRMDRHL